MKNDFEKSGAVDFAPDLSLPKENITRKTSINFDIEVAQQLDRKKVEDAVNVSSLVNRVLADYFKTEKEINDCAGLFNAEGYVKVELLMHVEVAKFLKLLEALNGSIRLADKIAELLSYDSAGLMDGNTTVYGDVSVLPKALAAFNRATQRVSGNPQGLKNYSLLAN